MTKKKEKKKLMTTKREEQNKWFLKVSSQVASGSSLDKVLKSQAKTLDVSHDTLKTRYHRTRKRVLGEKSKKKKFCSQKQIDV